MNGKISVGIKFCRPVFFICLFIQTNVYSQASYESLNHQLRNFNSYPRILQEMEGLKESVFHPNLNSDIDSAERIPYRNYMPVNKDDSSFLLNTKYKQYSWFRRKLLYENFIIIDTGILYITIDPLLNVSRGKEVLRSSNNYTEANDNIYNNTRGIILRADIGKKLSFESYFYENQSSFPAYIENFVTAREVVPGQGRVKNFKDGDFDFAQSGAYFSYAPFKSFNLQFGHHKQFIGDGYRSLILSDNSFNYPFLRMNFAFLKNKLRYSVMYTSFQDLERRETSGTSEGVFIRKAGSYHILEYEFSKKFRINLIQGMIWPMVNDLGDVEFDPLFFNPLILTYPAAKGMDDKNNTILGLGFKLNPVKRLEIYSQVVIDDGVFKKTAFQLGSRIFIAKKAFIQIEGNFVGPNTYSAVYGAGADVFPEKAGYNNSNVHYNEALGPNLMNDFEEIILRTGYRYKRFIPDLQINYSFRRNISSVKVFWAKMELAYLLNPATNLKIFTSYSYRSILFQQYDDRKNDIFFFGIKTDLRNIYYDF